MDTSESILSKSLSSQTTGNASAKSKETSPQKNNADNTISGMSHKFHSIYIKNALLSQLTFSIKHFWRSDHPNAPHSTIHQFSHRDLSSVHSFISTDLFFAFFKFNSIFVLIRNCYAVNRIISLDSYHLYSLLSFVAGCNME